MDDDEDDRDFSKSIVYGFFEQAENTFEKMDSNMYGGKLYYSFVADEANVR